MTDDATIEELAVRTAIGVMAATASAANPGLGVVAAGIQPALEMALLQIADRLGRRRAKFAAETLQDAADAAGAVTAEEFLDFVGRAVGDERQHELLARALLLAQDTASRDKRRALGRAIAAGTADDGARVDEEQLFVRVLDELDVPHIRLLQLMATVPTHYADRGDAHRAWMPWAIKVADAGLADVMYSLVATLERHGLIWGSRDDYPTPVQTMEREYQITGYGEWLLARLAPSEPEDLP